MRNAARVLLRWAVVIVLTAPVCAQGPVPSIALPNKDMAPGAKNPNITQANIKNNICKKGWSTKSIRPTTSYTNALKLTQLEALDDNKPNKLPRIRTKSGK